MKLIDNIIDRIADKVVDRIDNKVTDETAITQKSGSWDTLWLKSMEDAVFGNKVTQPYRQISSVYKAVKAIADNVPQAELAFYDYGSEKRIYPDDLIKLFENPNPLMNGIDFIQAVVGFYALYSESFVIQQKSIGQAAGTKGLPAELWTFNPSDFQEQKDRDGNIVGWKVGQTPFEKDDVIRFGDFNPYNRIRSFAPTEPIQKIIDIDWQSLVWNKAFFDNFTQLGLTLTTDKSLNDDDRARLKLWIKEHHQSASKAFNVAVFEKGLKAENTQMSMKDMDFLESKKYSREEILGIWRAPKALFNITEDLNYATFIGQMKIFWIYTIEPILKKVEAAFNRSLIQPYNPNIYCQFDKSNVTVYQEEFKDKVQTGQILFNMGFTGNEINQKLQLGFEEQEWRNSWWIPFSLSPAGQQIETPPEYTEAEVPEKSIKNKKDRKNFLNEMKGKFLKIHGGLENKFYSTLKRYFYEQRTEVLKEVNKSAGKFHQKDAGDLIDWTEQDDILKRRTMPHISSAVNEGISFAEAMGIEAENMQNVQFRASSLIAYRSEQIKRINRTIKNQITMQIDEGIKAGETVQQISDRIRNIYNFASARSLTIARTEITGSLNGGSDLYYKEAGVEKKRWLTANDEAVRESHQLLEGETIPISGTYSNGLQYPGADGPASEVCNCRCTEEPVIDEE